MPSHKEHKILPYTAKQMLNLVLDIENYPQFLPWCSGAKITERFNENHMHADLVINFKSFFQKYSSDIRVIKVSENEFRVDVISIDGPFKSLINNWHFKDIGDDQKPSVAVEFFINFEFQSLILGKMIGVILEKATKKMIDAFEKRAAKLYTKAFLNFCP
jgi:coenzyme Q-binding protein COQ10